MSISKPRCPWPIPGDELYLSYHDTEWGVPLFDDQKIFEYLVLESFQAGLSWRTVLHKRENFRIAFKNFNIKKVSEFKPEQMAKLLTNEGIIRNRAKIEAATHNAKMFLEIIKEYASFSSYMWSWVQNKPIQHRIKDASDYPNTTPTAEAWAKDLKKRGFKFLGPTVVYAHMQATGMVNDHIVNCFRYKQIKNINNLLAK